MYIDLKRGPIERTIRQYVLRRREQGSKSAGLIVNCMGMRAEESNKRAKLTTFSYSKRNSLNGREWYDWLPIHHWTEGEVFAKIAEVGQKPLWVYEAGMTRASCCFCIMASRADLKRAAELNPTLYRRYVMLERSTGQVMMMPAKLRGQLQKLNLEEITGIKIDVTEKEAAACA